MFFSSAMYGKVCGICQTLQGISSYSYEDEYKHAKMSLKLSLSPPNEVHASQILRENQEINLYSSQEIHYP